MPVERASELSGAPRRVLGRSDAARSARARRRSLAAVHGRPRWPAQMPVHTSRKCMRSRPSAARGDPLRASRTGRDVRRIRASRRRSRRLSDQRARALRPREDQSLQTSGRANIIIKACADARRLGFPWPGRSGIPRCSRRAPGAILSVAPPAGMVIMEPLVNAGGRRSCMMA